MSVSEVRALRCSRIGPARPGTSIPAPLIRARSRHFARNTSQGHAYRVTFEKIHQDPVGFSRGGLLDVRQTNLGSVVHRQAAFLFVRLRVVNCRLSTLLRLLVGMIGQ